MTIILHNILQLPVMITDIYITFRLMSQEIQVRFLKLQTFMENHRLK